MGVVINGNVGHVTNFEKDGVQVNIFDKPDNLSQLIGELNGMKSIADERSKQEIQIALDALKEKNENKFISSLKKIIPFIERVGSSVVGSAIVAYMKAQGLLP